MKLMKLKTDKKGKQKIQLILLKNYKKGSEAPTLKKGVRALPLSCRNDKGFLLFNDTILRGQGVYNKTKETKAILIKRKG